MALARALYREAPFLVLDEPTAALDPEAEAEVYRDFGRIAGDRTALYISHRPVSYTHLQMQKFVEMCFDPTSPMNARLKETLLMMLQEGTHEEHK